MDEAAKKIRDMEIYIEDKPCDVFDIKRITRQVAKELDRKGKKLDLVVVDYLQKIKPHKAESKRVLVSEQSNHLQNYPKLFGVPFLVVSSLKRAAPGHENDPPTMSDFKESGDIEFDADVIMLVHRDFRDGIYQSDGKVFVPKQRDGETGFTRLFFNGGLTKFENPR